MPNVILWDRIVEKYKANSKNNSSFLLDDSKLLKVNNKEITILVNSLSFSILNTNGDSYKLLLSICKDVMGDDFTNLVITKNTDIKSEPIKEINANYKEKFSYDNTNLSPNYTFDSFFYFEDNLKVINAAKLIINTILKNNDLMIDCNTLFIHGVSGIGKTHIVNAIGNELHKKNEELRILYSSAFEFANNYSALYRDGGYNNDKINSFKEKYYNNDVLILDDIQSLEGKESTLNEFFAVFDNNIQSNKVTIITSDLSPNKLNINSRILTRFTAGLVVQMNPPDTNTMEEILKYNVKKNDINITDGGINIIANAAPNARELLGFIQKIQLELICSDNDNFILDEQNALNLVSDVQKNITISRDVIIDTVCKYYDIERKELEAKKKNKEIIKIKNIIVILLVDMLQITYKNIAFLLKYKSHSNISKIYKKKEKIIKENIDDFTKISQLLNKK